MIKFLFKNDTTKQILRQEAEIDRVYTVARQIQYDCMTQEQIRRHPRIGTDDLWAIHKELDSLNIKTSKYRILIHRLRAMSSFIYDLKYDLEQERALRRMADGIIEEYKILLELKK